MKISFAIPFYSTPEFLDAAVRSVLAQNYPDWELVIVDDRSPHAGIREQVEGYGDARIRYHLNEKNLGQGGNWNQCLDLARHELVTLLHADDMLLPSYAEIMVDAATRHPQSWAYYCRAKIIDGQAIEIFSFADFYKRFLVPSLSEEHVVAGEAGLRALIKGNFIMCPTLCYRKQKLGSLRFSSDWKCAPDLDFTSRLLLAGGDLVGMPQVAFAYRRHEDAGTTLFRRNMAQFEEEIRLYNQIGDLAESKGWHLAAAEAKRKRIVRLRLGYFGLKDLLQLRWGASINKLNLALRMR